MEFKVGWEVTKAEGPYERCGPLVGTSCPTRSEAGAGAVDVEVDQSTGNVYVFSDQEVKTGETLMAVFKPDGSEVLARFGKKAKLGEPTATTLGEIHESPMPGGIAVSPNGTVYIYDLNNFNNFYHRLMVFKETTPGNPKTYAYVEGGDIAAGFFGEGELPERPVTDATGNIYTATETTIEEYSPAQPKPPICKFEFAKGGIKAMTVNPTSGEPFFYTSADKQVHRLGPCSGGKFSEVQLPIKVAPERDNLFALAFDPVRILEAGRAAGVLYGAAPSPVPGSKGKGEPGMGALGYIFAPAIEAEPVVESQAVGKVSATGAELEAQVNPKGSLTSYTFQYITQTAFEADGETFGPGTLESPSPPTVLGAGQSPLRASTVLTGLAPDTAYRFRAVAESHCSGSEPEKVCEDEGPAASFRTYPVEVAGPPDARAYELVSPAKKNGGQVLPAEPITSTCGLAECKPGAAFTHFPMQSAPDGEAVVYEGTPFSPSEGAVIENEYLARRTPSGWATANLTPPLLQSKGAQGYKAFDQTLSEGVLEQSAPSFGAAPPNYANLYRQPSADPLTLTPLITQAPPNRVAGNGSNSFRTTYAGASVDFSHLIFEANDALSEGALDPTEEEADLYEAVGGELRLVNVLPNESTEPGVLGSGTLLKSGDPNTPAGVVDGAISADGRRIFWTSKAGALYVREDGTTTTEIEDPGKFLAAGSDGSRVLLSDGCLYVLETKACTDLTQGQGGFQGIAGHSADLSHLYFVDTAVLTEEPNSQGDKAVAAEPNLYAWTDGQAEPQTSFIATLLPGDNTNSAGDWQASPAVRTAEASPAGRYLAFLSTAKLTGVPNVGPCQLEGSSGKYINAACTEVFLYDSAAQTLSCPSCNRSGSAPLGPSVLRLIKGARGSLPQPRYLTDSGRLYFDSADALSYLDTNGRVEDVYQYEPQALGGCGREGGCVSLVSAGRSSIDSNLLTIDASGNNVFFTSRDRLVGADTDEQIDLYDARVEGGFAEPKPPIPCGGEACQPQSVIPPEAPPAPAPPGAGNYKPPKKCPKGKVRRGGKCVKKHKGKSKGSKAKRDQRRQGALR
jgi:hypothetical protein